MSSIISRCGGGRVAGAFASLMAHGRSNMARARSFLARMTTFSSRGAAALSLFGLAMVTTSSSAIPFPVDPIYPVPGPTVPLLTANNACTVIGCSGDGNSVFDGSIKVMRTCPQDVPGIYALFAQGWLAANNCTPTNSSCAGCPESATWPGVLRKPLYCPKSFTLSNGKCYPDSLVDDNKNPQQCPANGSNPIHSALGTKLQTEQDIAANGSSRLSFGRYYTSGLHVEQTTLGRQWRHSYDYRLYFTINGATGTAISLRPDGSMMYFNNDAGTWSPESDVADRLTPVFKTGTQAGWTLTHEDDSRERYNMRGLLESIEYTDGDHLQFLYDAAGVLLQKVVDARGRSLTFSYFSNPGNPDLGRIASVLSSDGTGVTYGYNSNGLLSTATYADLTPLIGTDNPFRQYLYGEGGVANYLLTGIVDERNNRYASWSYDPVTSRAVLSVHGTTSDYIDRVEFSYSGDIHLTESATTAIKQWVNHSATSPAQQFTQRTYGFAIRNGVVKLASATQPCATCGGGNAQNQSYDVNGNPDVLTDFRGTTTDRDFDEVDALGRPRGLESQRIEAANDNASASTRRRIVTTWDSAFRLPRTRLTYDAANVLQAKSSWDYNVRGQATARCEIDVADTNALSYVCSSTSAPAATLNVRRWTTTYCDVIDSNCPLIGLVKATNGPRLTTDAGLGGLDDTVAYTYYMTDDESGCDTPGGACHRKGDLWKITNALGQVNEIVSYDRTGRVARSKDANGTVTDMTYHPRGWLLIRAVRFLGSGFPTGADATTAFEYDATGQVSKVIQPDGAFMSYSYDSAHRLTDVEDNLGNRIHYSLDDLGNRLGEEMFSGGPAPVLKHAMTREYNALNRLIRMRNASNAPTWDSTLFNGAPLSNDGYDANGNSIQSADGLGIDTRSEFDPLNRLSRTLQDYAGIDPATHDATTEYSYDVRDNLRTVKDPSLLTTTYTYDALNNLIQLSSPDTGQTLYTYDRAGNRITQTDSRGTASTHVYDALNRLTATNYADAAQNVSFLYDQSNAVTGCLGSFPLGRQTGMVDPSGSTTYCYDRRGNVRRKTQITNGVSFVTEYSYDLADRLATLTYPSGAIVAYVRDAVGRIFKVTWQANASAAAIPVVSNATYYPFGPLNVLTYGNARTLTKTYDNNYAIDKVVSSDPNGLVLEFTTDAMGNIVDASNAVNAVFKTRKYVHDNLYRLSDVTSGANTMLEDYAYNLTGDRISKQLGTQPAQVYTYLAGTHHLGSVAGVNRGYDANGNTTKRGDGNTLDYDARNRLWQFTVPTPKHAPTNITTYIYNGKGERVSRQHSSSGLTSQWTYNESGQLLGTYTGSGVSAGTEIVYLDSTPVAQLSAGALSYLETDHLGTPRIAANPASNAQQWKWDFFADAFGGSAATTAPSDGIDVKLRYPGQIHDAETGLHYNYFRDYEPETGRYVESDPIGLDGGIATFQYALSDPIGAIDEDGLSPMIARLCARYPRACAAMTACSLNPARCVQLYCKASSTLRLYKIPCTGTPACNGSGSALTTNLKTLGWCTCYVNRVFEKYICRKGKSDQPHDDQILISRRHCERCFEERCAPR
jgi:RHS repeat-associated protein